MSSWTNKVFLSQVLVECVARSLNFYIMKVKEVQYDRGILVKERTLEINLVVTQLFRRWRNLKCLFHKNIHVSTQWICIVTTQKQYFNPRGTVWNRLLTSTPNPRQKMEDFIQTLLVFPRAQLSANLQGFKPISNQKQRLRMRIKASGSSRALRSDGCSIRERKMTLYLQVITSNSWQIGFILFSLCYCLRLSPNTQTHTDTQIHRHRYTHTRLFLSESFDSRL